MIISINTRLVVGYSHSKKSNTSLVLEALEKTIKIYGKPNMISSDRGSVFVSKEYTETLKKYSITKSMSLAYKAVDNKYIETLFHSMKSEIGDITNLNEEEYIMVVDYWIYYYNNIRINSKIINIPSLQKYLKSLDNDKELCSEIKNILTENEFKKIHLLLGLIVMSLINRINLYEFLNQFQS